MLEELPERGMMYGRRGAVFREPSRGGFHDMQVTTAAACQGGCSRLRGYLLTATRTIASRSSTMRYFRNSENLMTTTSHNAALTHA